METGKKSFKIAPRRLLFWLCLSPRYRNTDVEDVQVMIVCVFVCVRVCVCVCRVVGVGKSPEMPVRK